tara:strand:- start:89 stop:2230 length:2142 start_codon:yes stop_codon:yes gene_type:complete
MGGPAQPMPQDMASPAQQLPPEAAMLQQVEQASAAQGQELGKAYAEQMMQGIDAAQSTEELINAFRGNEMPLDARRDELADYVGQGDADQTPESVLAMVQPVIMMTEEGAMNSGIGNLMQQLTGDIDMITEGGQPTDMGQGVGSLMMAGAPEAPAPQNFRQGGEVAFLQDASTPTATAPSDSFRQLRSSEIAKLLSGDFNFGTEVETQYESLLPLFRQIGLEDRAQQEQERKEMDEAQVLLSLARGGLRLAAGDRGTSGSLVSQIGSAFEPTAAEISAIAAQSQDRRDALRAQDQQLRLGALQAGISQAGAQQTLDLKRSIATLDALLGPQTAVDEVTVRFPDGTPKTLDLRTQFAEYRDAIDNKGALVVEPEESSRYGSGVTGQALNRLSRPDNLVHLVKGIQGDRSEASLTALNDLAQIQEFDPQTGRALNTVPVHLQPFVRLINDEVALRNFQEESADQIATFNKEYEQLASDIANRQKDPSELYKYVDARIATIAGLDMESATGLPSGLLNFVEAGAQQLGDVFGSSVRDFVGDGISDVDQARRIMDSVLQSVDRYVAGAPNESRLLQQQYENLKEQLPKASMFETDASAQGALQNYRDLINTDLEQLRILIKDAQLQKPSDLGRFRYRLMQAYNLRELLNALAVNYKSGPGGRDIPSALITKENLEEYLGDLPLTQDLPGTAITQPPPISSLPDLDKYFYSRTPGGES